MDLSTAQNIEQLIKWFAAGKTVSEIAILAQTKLDLDDWTVERAAAFRNRYSEDILNYLRDHSAELLRSVSISHKSVRVQNIETLCELLSDGVKECAEASKWPSAAKLTDTICKAYRLVGEETNDLAKPLQATNVYIQLIQSAPPEKRKKIAQRVSEIEALLSANPEAVLDGDFSVENLTE